MIDNIQDEALAKQDLRDQERLEELRAPWEDAWHEIDERFPQGAGGFNKGSPAQLRNARNFDSQHILSLGKFAAAGVAITTPEQDEYIRPFFLDEDLNQQRSVQLWRERTGRRMKQIRHAAHTGFNIAVNEDWDQLGRYGTSALWSEATPRGMVYRCLHLSEIYIDVDFAGLVNRVHRKFEKTARQCEELFGLDALTPKMREALEPGRNRENEKFEILHVVAPNRSWDRDSWSHDRYPVSSRYLAMNEKIYVKRKGYRTMPVSVSRHATSAGEIYGRSPAFDVMPNIQGLNTMKHTTLRAAHKAVDPALIFHHDGTGAKRIASKPGGMNPGFMSEEGRPLVGRMPGGENGIPIALEMMEAEKAPIRISFLEEFYKILTDPNSRMTTTEVLEVMAKQGVLVRPYASRYETEKQHPMTQRDLELFMAAEQIEPFPDEVKEAGAWPLIAYENPLAAMARAENTAKSMRYMEAIVPLANAQPDVLDRIDADAMAKGMAEEIGVKPSYIRSDEEVAKIRAGRAEQEQAAIDAELLEKSAGAVKDLAQAGSYGEAA